MKLLKNKYFLFGNLIVILLIIPVTLYFIHQNQANRTKAAPSTILSLVDPQSDQATVTIKKGSQFTLNVMVNPGQNIVSIVDMYLTFDPQKVKLLSMTKSNNFPTVLRGPTINADNANYSVNIGADVTKAITSPTPVATLTFQAVDLTTSGPTTIGFDQNTSRVFSLSAADQPGENVLQSTQPAQVTISDSGATTSPTVTTTVSPTITPTAIPSTQSTVTPTTAAVASPTVTPTSGPVTQNQLPICTGLSVDRNPSGTAPFSIAITANGNDPDGTIQKVTFNFGDGPAQDVTSTGGIGTNTVSIQVSHTYNNAGTYQAAAILTDDRNGVSSSSAICSKTITVTQPASNGGSGGSGGTNGNGGAIAQATPIPTLAPTGNNTTMIGIISGILLTVLGGVVLLVL